MPLVGSLLPFRNKLAYPAGVKPGFDPAHPASQRVGFTGIAQGPNFINLLTGGPGTPANSPTAAILGFIGPVMVTSSSGTGQAEFTSPTTAPTIVTMAGIFTTANGSGTQVFLIDSTSNSAGVALCMLGAAPSIAASNLGATYVTFTLPSAIVANAPYFLAISMMQISGGFTGNMVLCRLDTGVTYAQSTTNGNSTFIGTTDGNTSAQGGGFAQSRSGAAWMWNLSFMSLPALVQWGADPWAFWYPRTPIDWVGKIAAVTVLPFVRRNIIRASAKGFR